jgi:2,5-diamino-6-(ribosylamino)-4(3H)-pyrimidinone 5'-phosphate reductase
MKDKFPYVVLNVATTADGKTDTFARRGAAISSPRDLDRVDGLRASCDAIMVGGNTLLGDDPRLTVKSATLRAERRARGQSENPIKVGVVTQADLRLDSRFLAAGPARLMIFTTARTGAEQIARLRDLGVEVFVMGEQRIDLASMMICLKPSGIGRLLLEGGGTLNLELLRQGLVDEINVYVAPLIFGGASAPTWADGVGLTRDDAIPLHLVTVENLDDDGVLLRYLVSPHN